MNEREKEEKMKEEGDWLCVAEGDDKRKRAGEGSRTEGRKEEMKELIWEVMQL